jgi:2-isopropylmalate synthase
MGLSQRMRKVRFPDSIPEFFMTQSDSLQSRLSNNAPISDLVRIFDTTLRDGEQAPGCSMTSSEKLRVAQQLAALGVDVIEAGFPAASPGEVDAVRNIATDVGSSEGPVICALARANTRDIETCAYALAPAARRRIHTFIATSDIHLEHKLRMTRMQILDVVREAVTYARSLCEDVEFSAEDASRSNPAFLCDVFAVAVGCGATTVNIPDTVGYATPPEYAALVARVIAVVGSPAVTVSTHCHNDLGMAVANTLAGVKAGARQVECTVNGLGERAGNASLEEVVMALHTRQAYFGLATAVNTRELTRASHAVIQATGVTMPCNKAIVGANAFAHEAGIHQDGVLKHRETYEIMRADQVGAAGSLVLGKHSGRNAFHQHVRDHLGLTLDDDVLQRAFSQFKTMADERKVMTIVDIEKIVRDAYPSGAHSNA